MDALLRTKIRRGEASGRDYSRAGLAWAELPIFVPVPEGGFGHGAISGCGTAGYGGWGWGLSNGFGYGNGQGGGHGNGSGYGDGWGDGTGKGDVYED